MTFRTSQTMGTLLVVGWAALSVLPIILAAPAELWLVGWNLLCPTLAVVAVRRSTSRWRQSSLLLGSAIMLVLSGSLAGVAVTHAGGSMIFVAFVFFPFLQWAVMTIAWFLGVIWDRKPRDGAMGMDSAAGEKPDT